MIDYEIIDIHPCTTHKFTGTSWTFHWKLLRTLSQFVLSHHYVRTKSRWMIILWWRLVSLIRIIISYNSLCRLELITHSLLLRLHTINLIFFLNHQINLATVNGPLIFLWRTITLNYPIVLLVALLLIQHLYCPVLQGIRGFIGVVVSPWLLLLILDGLDDIFDKAPLILSCCLSSLALLYCPFFVIIHIKRRSLREIECSMLLESLERESYWWVGTYLKYIFPSCDENLLNFQNNLFGSFNLEILSMLLHIGHAPIVGLAWRCLRLVEQPRLGARMLQICLGDKWSINKK